MLGFVLVVCVAVIAISVVTLDVASRPLAARLIGTWLSAHGADSTIEILSVSDHGLSARVRVGDARNPELTIDRLDVGYVLAAPWAGKGQGFTARSVRLVRPRLRLRLANGAPDFCHLTGLVRWVQSQPASTQPLPDIRIEDGEVQVTTDSGLLRLVSVNALASGPTGSLQGRIAPFRQRTAGLTVESAGGSIGVTRSGPRLAGRLLLGPGAARGRDANLGAASALLVADLPFPDPSGRWTGPARLDLTLDGALGAAKAGRAEGGAGQVTLTGDLEAIGERQAFRGVLQGHAAAASASAQGLILRNPSVDLNPGDVSIVHDLHGVLARAGGKMGLVLASVEAPGGTLTHLTASASLTGGRLSLIDGAVTGEASLRGAASAMGGLSASASGRIVKAIPILGGERPYAAPLAAALHDIRFSAMDWRLDIDGSGARLGLAAPIRLASASGAVLTLSGQGAFQNSAPWRASGDGLTLALSGGDLPTVTLAAESWSATPAALQAGLAVKGVFATRLVQDAHLDAKGRLEASPGRIKVVLDGCAPLGARRLGDGASAAEDIALQLCTTADPLFDAGVGRWRARGRIDALRGDSPGSKAGLRDTALSFEAGGSPDGLKSADIRLTRARVVDRGDPVRFRPLTLAGALGLAGDAWRGDLSVADSKGRPLGKARLEQSTRTGAGRLDLNADGLDFAPGGLQPVDLTPLAGPIHDASGHVAFKGWFSWTRPGEARSGGDLAASSLRFTGPLGLVENLAAAVHFTSLAPPATAPGQSVSIGAVRTVIPVTNLAFAFGLDADTFHLERATGDFSGGSLSLDPIMAPLSGAGRFDSAVVLHRVDIGDLIAASNLADKVKIQAKVDGRIPFSVGPGGVTVTHGLVAAIAGGRLSISRSVFDGGAKPAVADQSSFAQDFAYQAMENLSFDSLDASLDSQAHDRLGILFHIKGRHDPPTPQRAVFRLDDLLRGRAFSKPIQLPSDTKIDLTLDTSLNFGELVGALEAAWADTLSSARTQRRTEPR